MKKIFFTQLVLLSSFVFAAPKVVKTERVGLNYQLTGAKVTASAAGTVQFTFNVQYSNSCVAGSSQLNVLANEHAAYNKEGEATSNFLFLAVEEKFLELACPMLYRPVVVSYTTTVDNLQSRTDYEVHILGGNKDPKDPVFVTKVTTK